MGFLNVILAILDSRTISTIWFWIMLATVWMLVGRNVLGVPPDVIRRVPRDPNGPDTPEALTLLDWLSLVLPRWRVARTEGVILLGAVSFLISTLTLLGFGYGLEMAQALVFLLFPVVLHVAMGLGLAARLRPVMSAAHAQQITANEAAARAARSMAWHRLVMSVATVLGMTMTALWGAVWIYMYFYLLF